MLQKLSVLLIANNKIKNWDEVAKLAPCSGLRIIMLLNNPIYNAPTRDGNWPKIVRSVPQIESIDGVMVSAHTRIEAENMD